jgi:hypothetical protein
MPTPNENTIDAAFEWIAKAQQLGYYNGNVARLIRAGAEAVRSVLGADEDRSLQRIEQDADGLYLRLVNKAGSINAATAQTYVARTKRLISDYQAWLSDPRSFKPSMRRTRGPARAAAAPSGAAAAGAGWLPFVDANGASGRPESGGTAYREHTLSLSTGRAYLRIPASISADDVALLTLVIRSHGKASAADPTSSG